MLKKAILENGRVIKYFPDMIGDGSLKQVYLTKDKEFVICFYKNYQHQTDPNRLYRLQKIVNEFNPTLVGKRYANYWNNLFCWPSKIVVKPKLGIVVPIYPSNYFFKSGNWAGKEKKGRWFISPKLKQYLPKEEQGNWINYFKISILLVRAVGRLHFSGLAHSDLSDNNVLIDPSSGKMTIIDIDSLVVPTIFPPDVDGTPGYIAPEVIASSRLSINDSKKQFANIRTDQHALAVLIYEYLLNRHPLRGSKIHAFDSVEEDEYLSMGEKALFIENPNDLSNLPQEDVFLPVTILGSSLTQLFYQAFITGLHNPHERPTAYEWEKSLVKTWNMLYPCPNKNCSHQWFIVNPDEKTVISCPFCHIVIKHVIPMFIIYIQNKPGQWIPSNRLIIYHGQRLFKWHVFDHIFPGPDANKNPLAYFIFHQGKWLLINQNLHSLSLINGNRIDSNQVIILIPDMQILLSKKQHNCLVKVKMLNVYS
ncbi:MAG: hypothetical protein KAH84_01455 [Thiomargarita sp.]|nr:hypothetical protein [Thiomargarita sp.]